MDIKCYCKAPPSTKQKYRSLSGGCPPLLGDLISELQGANEIHIAAYLFNSPPYFEALKKLSEEGCKIFITSIPLRGYDDKVVWVEGYSEKMSGRDFAKDTYEAVSKCKNIKMFIFPHMYMWYGALYAGGGASYSFHVKAVFAKYTDGSHKCILSSGNFMCTDPPHSDNIIVIKDNSEYTNAFIRFFNDVETHAIPYNEYNLKYDSLKHDFDYSFFGKEIDIPVAEAKNCFFTAPFYNIGGNGSNHYAAKRFSEIISSAKERVWICAQHFHDVSSYDASAEDTIVKSIYGLWQNNPSIELRFLKQVPHFSLADKRRAAITEVLSQFVMKSNQRANKLVHDKFIIVDNTLIITTANYTPTQFATGLRKMDMAIDGVKCRKEDVFSEVNGFILLPDCPEKIIQQYESHFNSLWDTGTDISIEL